MTIRKTLLVAFLGLGLGTSMVLTALAFVKARDALRSEIDRNVRTEAEGLAAEIDKMMFERLQNAAIWSRLDIMQDMKVEDIDKRLSHFLDNLHEGYRDVYVHLDCIDMHDRIVSSSTAALVGTRAAPIKPWLTTRLSGPLLSLGFVSSGNDDPDVAIEVPVMSSFSAEQLGTLRLLLDWSEIETVLDRAAGENGRVLAVLDREGRLIGASRALRDRHMLLSEALSAWRDRARHAGRYPGAPITRSEVIVGGAHSPGYAQFAGFGWTTLIVQPLDLALAPVHRMGEIFLLLLAGIALLTVLIALWVSHEIARPIVALTAFARGYMRKRVLDAPAVAGSGEVGELGRAFVRMVQDIDQSERDLVRASKLAVVGEMSSMIAHEVRTPLGIMRSSAQMLRHERDLSEEGRELVGFIESETQRLNGLVSTMLDSARMRPLAFARVNLHDLIARTIAMLGAQAARRQIVVTTHPDAVRPDVDCDEEQIMQVVLNLLMNGFQAIAAGGRVDIATHDDGADVTIDIADDGPGIPPEERAKVFDAFFFKREGGVGLGLAIVQQIVVAHGGRIEAGASALGGALFRIRLPRRHEDNA